MTEVLGWAVAGPIAAKIHDNHIVQVVDISHQVPDVVSALNGNNPVVSCDQGGCKLLNLNRNWIHAAGWVEDLPKLLL